MKKRILGVLGLIGLSGAVALPSYAAFDFTMNASTTDAFTNVVTPFLETYWGQVIGFTVALLGAAFFFVLAGAGIRWVWRRVRRIGGGR